MCSVSVSCWTLFCHLTGMEVYCLHSLSDEKYPRKKKKIVESCSMQKLYGKQYKCLFFYVKFMIVIFRIVWGNIEQQIPVNTTNKVSNKICLFISPLFSIKCLKFNIFPDISYEFMHICHRTSWAPHNIPFHPSAVVVPTCSQPIATGSCTDQIPRFAFDEALGTCQLFLYTGCSGNDNNFATFTECLATCVPGENLSHSVFFINIFGIIRISYHNNNFFFWFLVCIYI